MNLSMRSLMVPGLLNFAFLATVPAVPQYQKVILHFDVNRTILADDPAGGK